jgi:error-prone DNA polymerase
VIEWDKDDLDALGILKIDVLALGMLTCIRKAFELIRTHYGKTFTLKSVPQDDPTVYEMLSRADSIGVFQVESRAQMSMLPRLKPREFYDLVIEVAIVRPGPIQGDMVHPYLRRREGRERVEYPSQELHEVLGKTLGVPLFQEQAMRIAMVAAGFSAEEADELRRAMATFKRNGDIHRFEAKMVEGMVARGYEREFAERCFSQIRGFGTYGFPESHAASFALLVYISAWIKRHYPDAFAAALLNSQPMGFYAPAQIVRDASEHGVEIRGPDVNASRWDCTLEPRAPSAAGSSSGAGNRWALRLGLREIKGFRRADADALVARRAGSYASPRALWADCGFGAAALEKLAVADAFRSMGLDRRQVLWAIKGLGEPPPPLLAGAIAAESVAPLPPMRLGEHVAEDYDTLGLSLRQHPLAFLRDSLAAEGVVCAADLAYRPVGHRLTVAGLALIRQRPGTAKDVVFVTIEDETGSANLIVWPGVFERFRRAVMGATLLACTGKLQREGAVIHVIAERLADFSPRLAALRRAPPGDAAGPAPAPLRVRSRDFR